MKEVCNEFSKLLEQEPEERELQLFLERYPTLLSRITGGSLSLVKPKINIHKYEMDFACCTYWESIGKYEWTLVEIERSSHFLFRKNGDPTSALSHAIRQVLDWRQWIEDNSSYAKSILKDIDATPKGLVIIGRRSTLSDDDKKRLSILNASLYKMRIRTFDSLLDEC